MQDTTIKEIVRIAIATPYLLENISESHDAEYVRKQIEMFGYDPNNLINERKIITDKNIVAIDTAEEHSKLRPHLMIIGCTRKSEKDVASRKGSGLLFARYSIFYGDPSDYTGNYPDDSGYALDMPKDHNIVKALLKHDDFLEAIVERDETKIKSALDNLNSIIAKPILVTSYLAEALKYR